MSSAQLTCRAHNLVTYLDIGVGRGGQGGGGQAPQSFERGGQHTLWPPPNNPPTFSYNFYVKQEKNTNVQVEG